MSAASIPAAPQTAEKPRSRWDRILTLTPVILTVIATTLAGMSSSEMGRAQYYRALAAQHQSKVSDQWNFFQAKRIRGTTLEMTASLLHSLSDPEEIPAEAVQTAAARLPENLRQVAREGEQLRHALTAARAALGKSAEPLDRASEVSQQKVARLIVEAAAERDRIAAAFAAGGATAFRYLDGKSLPSPAEETNLQKALLEACAAIHAGIPDAIQQFEEGRAVAGLTRIGEEDVRRAIETAEAKAKAFDKLCEPTNASLRDLEARVTALASLTRQLHRATEEVSLALSAVPASETKTLVEVRLAAAAIQRTDAVLKEQTEALSNNLKAAHVDYTARRYGREAQYNRFISTLYELQVRRAGLQSDRHRERSFKLFYAMLAAQAGTTIATFSMAVRQRSLLWALAALAGLSALALGGYGFLEEIQHMLDRAKS